MSLFLHSLKSLAKGFFLLLLVNLLAFTGLNAAHIIGGVVTYECTSPGQYIITLKVYRDCQGGGAQFDSNGANSTPGTISIFHGSSTQEFDNVILGAPNVTRINPDDNPCLVLPPNVCVEEGVYTFSVNLPVSDESYHIVYQRCCRNNTITNILNPESSGATYTVEITPKAQEICNDSPVFDEFPPIVICNGEPLDFNHAATDNDTATQLVYEFCTPLLGGGTDGVNGGSATAVTGVAPNPDAPPPYSGVNFRLPNYAFNRPIAGDPEITIDPNTGIITGVPNINGQFVVGVCVKEFLDGELISTIRRDFQFNVATCERTVFAGVEADLVDGNNFEIINCGSSTVFFDNQSFQEQFITDYYWEFDINGDIQTFDSRDLTIIFPGLGTYEGVMIVNKSAQTNECKDTANITVNIYPDIDANFMFDYDTCIAGEVSFIDLSSTGSGQMTNWDWDFADSNFGIDQNPLHNYLIPGDFPVNLEVTDINNCKEDTTINVKYYPVPNLVIIEPSQFRGCAPGDIFFNNLTTPIDETYEITWNFGDGSDGSTDISPTHAFLNPGVFDISVDIVSPLGCETSAFFNDWIEILPGPVADFSFTPETPDNFNTNISFFDESTNANSWFWDFNGDGNAFIRNPVHNFRDTGLKAVTLLVTRENGCTDTITKFIDIVPRSTYHLPNAFTPNGDGLNDEFKGNGIFLGIRDFQMNIWNRWGELVFETTSPDVGWNGTYRNTGKAAPKGVYVCIVQYTTPRGERELIETFATLVR